MAKPVILAVDDDTTILVAVERDLTARYGGDYRVVTAANLDDALEQLAQLRLRGEPVALVLADLQMPNRAGFKFLERASELAPDARRIALAAFTQNVAAVDALDDGVSHHTCIKPWDPPEERVYPLVDDLLADWVACYKPVEEAIRLIGYRWSPDDSSLRAFLARNHLPYRWIDAGEGDSGEEAEALLRALGLDESALPLLIFPDGSYLSQPDPREVADKAGLQTEPAGQHYDFVIVGGGPAGLAAAVYAASEGLTTLIIEREAPGGQAGQSARIENYLGFPSGLSGQELTHRARHQATRFGAEILTAREATGVEVDGRYKNLRLDDGREVSCEALLIATGVQYRMLDIKGCGDLIGAGVYYGAAMSDTMCVINSEAYIVGGGNSAGQAALYLARHARRVTLVVRRDGLDESMSSYLIARIEKDEKIRVLPRTEVVAAHGRPGDEEGEQRLDKLTLRNNRTGEEETVEASGLFIFVGAAPRTEWLSNLLLRDENGYVLTGPDVVRTARSDRRDGGHGWALDRAPFWLETSVPGVFAAGDVRSRSVKRVASAVGEGSMCVAFVHEYLAT
jgi:thioredoxin reductase (NADPH)